MALAAVSCVRGLGPDVSGVFNWGTVLIFRDDDPTDYARIVDDTGAVVHHVNCGEAPSEDTDGGTIPDIEDDDGDGYSHDDEIARGADPLDASSTPEPSPTPSLEASPPVGVPNGDGSPPTPGNVLSPLMMALIGASVAAAGLAAVARSWLRLPPPLLALPASPPGGAAALGAALRALTAVVAFLLLRRPS